MSETKPVTPAQDLAARTGVSTDGGGFSAFLSVWLPSFVVVIADGSCIFTLSWWISRSPNGGAQLGTIVGVGSAFALLSVTALSGLIDRSDRRRTIVRLLAVLAVPVAALVGVLGMEQSSAAVIMAGLCYMLLDAVESLYLATTETVVVDLAPASWPSARTSMLTQMHSQVERVVAPAVAGVMITAGALQAVPLVALVGIAAVGVTVYTFRRHIDVISNRIAVTANAGDEPRSGLVHTALRDALASLKLIRRHADLMFLVQLGILVNLVVFPFYAVLPAFIKEYAVPAREQAMLYSSAATAYGSGMLAGTLLLLRYRRREGGRRALGVATICFALICSILLVVTASPWPQTLVAAMAVNGALFIVLVAIGGAVWLNRTPADVRVRVFSLRRLTVFSSIPLGTMLIGFGGAVIGYRHFVRALVVMVLAALTYAWLRFRRRFLEPDHEEGATP